MKNSRLLTTQLLTALTLLFSSFTVAASDMTTPINAREAIPEKRDFILDMAVNPCQNFHQYVCGNVEKNFKLRDDRSSHTFAFDDSDERILEKKKSFFKNIQNERKLSARSHQLKDYYMACMSEKNSFCISS